MKYVLLFEKFLMVNYNKLDSFYDLPLINLQLDLPQVGSKSYSFTIINDKIISDEITPNVLYDFLVTEFDELIIGSQHYKMSKKAKQIKTCGELKISDEGKINYINNESGHYKPTQALLYETYIRFGKENLLSEDVKVDYLYS
jgi:hypothetical protein